MHKSLCAMKIFYRARKRKKEEKKEEDERKRRKKRLSSSPIRMHVWAEE